MGLPFGDLTGGFKGFRREVLENIEFDKVKSNGYSFQIELTYRTYLKNYRIKETRWRIRRVFHINIVTNHSKNIIK